MERAKQAKDRNISTLISKARVVSVGIGHKYTKGERIGDAMCVVVGVSRKIKPKHIHTEDLVPETVDGVVTDVIQVGKIRALGRTDRVRPAMGGVSIGHPDVTAGTFGCVVWKGATPFILSNNHVLANSNDAAIGDPILQPGPYDGGTMQDQIGMLRAFSKINFGEVPGTDCKITPVILAFFNIFAEAFGRKTRLAAFQKQDVTNLVDAALAEPLSPDLVDPDILDIGVPRNVEGAYIGMPLEKSGRTTGYTEGAVMQLDVVANVDYGGKVAPFERQIMAGNMSAGGDSGSLVLTPDKNAVGLLFAGSDQVTLMNPIELVLTALSVGIL